MSPFNLWVRRRRQVISSAMFCNVLISNVDMKQSVKYRVMDTRSPSTFALRAAHSIYHRIHRHSVTPRRETRYDPQQCLGIEPYSFIRTERHPATDQRKCTKNTISRLHRWFTFYSGNETEAVLSKNTIIARRHCEVICGLKFAHIDCWYDATSKTASELKAWSLM